MRAITPSGDEKRSALSHLHKNTYRNHHVKWLECSYEQLISGDQLRSQMCKQPIDSHRLLISCKERIQWLAELVIAHSLGAGLTSQGLICSA